VAALVTAADATGEPLDEVLPKIFKLAFGFLGQACDDVQNMICDIGSEASEGANDITRITTPANPIGRRGPGPAESR
jgi:hypothetical protein